MIYVTFNNFFKAGCGKSVLTSSVIDDFESAADNLQSSTAIAYYYCDHADKRTLDPVNIFSAIAMQIIQYITEFPQEIGMMIESAYLENKRTPDTEEICQILLLAIDKLPTVAIFIDGLDEVLEDERKMIFSNLRTILLHFKSSSIKLFVSSREDTSYLTKISSVRTFKVQVLASSIAEDISSYIKSSIQDLLRTNELVVKDTALKDEIFQVLVSGAKGM